MEMDSQTRQSLRSLNASTLTPAEVDDIINLMLLLDPNCGPPPRTARGKLVAVRSFLAYMQGSPSSLLPPPPSCR